MRPNPPANPGSYWVKKGSGELVMVVAHSYKPIGKKERAGTKHIAYTNGKGMGFHRPEKEFLEMFEWQSMNFTGGVS